MKQYFSLPMIWYYCLMERKMIYDDFHSFMLFYFLCLLLTHLILFHIFSVVTPGGEKKAFVRFRSSPPPQRFCIHLHGWRKLICEEKSFLMRQKQEKFNQRSIKITFMEKLILLDSVGAPRDLRDLYEVKNFCSNHAIFHNHQSFYTF